LEHGELNGRIFHSALKDHLSRGSGIGFGVNIPQSKELFKSQRTGRDSERGEGDLDESGWSGEKSRISGGERGVLRVGMVSEGGECGSQYPTFIRQDRENVW